MAEIRDIKERNREQLLKFSKNVYFDKSIDDPTILGFSIMFDWKESKLFAGCEEYTKDLLYPNLSEASILNMESRKKEDNAINFLNRNGEWDKARKLAKFVEHLNYINQEKGFVWQSIEGLDTIWEAMHDWSKNPIATEYEFSLKTLETIDLKIYGIMELYRQAVYDYDWYRVVLPSNLQRFNMTIFITDIRDFRPYLSNIDSTKSSNLGNSYGNIGLTDLTQVLGINNDVYGDFNFESYANKLKSMSKNKSVANQNDNMFPDSGESGLILEFTDCKFNAKSGGDIFQNVSNINSEQASNSIYISAKGVSIKSVLSWYENIKMTSETPSKSANKDFWDKLKKQGGNVLETAARQYMQKAQREQSSPRDLIIKNIPGGLYGSLQELQRGNYINAVSTLRYKNLGNVYDDKPNIFVNKNLGNVYGDKNVYINQTINKINNGNNKQLE